MLGNNKAFQRWIVPWAFLGNCKEITMQNVQYKPEGCVPRARLRHQKLVYNRCLLAQTVRSYVFHADEALESNLNTAV